MSDQQSLDSVETSVPKSSTAQIIDFLYNRFLLRDIVGKVVPGFLFLLIMVWSSQSYEFIETTIHLGNLGASGVVACSWLFALSSQSIQSRVMHFYFWRRDGQLKTISLLFRFSEREEEYMRVFDEEVRVFFRRATPDQKAQYERYLVIKEACANSFFCLALSIPFAVLIHIKIWLFWAIFLPYILTALYLMKQDNLYRQMAYARTVSNHPL